MKKPKRNRDRPSSKLRKLLTREAGATRKQILDAIGWKAINVYYTAKVMGLKNIKATKTRPIIYRATEPKSRTPKSLESGVPSPGAV